MSERNGKVRIQTPMSRRSIESEDSDLDFGELSEKYRQIELGGGAGFKTQQAAYERAPESYRIVQRKNIF